MIPPELSRRLAIAVEVRPTDKPLDEHFRLIEMLGELGPSTIADIPEELLSQLREYPRFKAAFV